MFPSFFEFFSQKIPKQKSGIFGIFRIGILFRVGSQNPKTPNYSGFKIESLEIPQTHSKTTPNKGVSMWDYPVTSENEKFW